MQVSRMLILKSHFIRFFVLQLWPEDPRIDVCMSYRRYELSRANIKLAFPKVKIKARAGDIYLGALNWACESSSRREERKTKTKTSSVTFGKSFIEFWEPQMN